MQQETIFLPASKRLPQLPQRSSLTTGFVETASTSVLCPPDADSSPVELVHDGGEIATICSHALGEVLATPTPQRTKACGRSADDVMK